MTTFKLATGHITSKHIHRIGARTDQRSWYKNGKMDSKRLHICATLTITTVYQTWKSISSKQPLLCSKVYDSRTVRRECYDGGGGGDDDICLAVRHTAFNGFILHPKNLWLWMAKDYFCVCQCTELWEEQATNWRSYKIMTV